MGLRLLSFLLVFGWANSALAMAICFPAESTTDYQSAVCEDAEPEENVDCNKDPASCQACTYTKGQPKITNPLTGSCEKGQDGRWRPVDVTCSCAKADKLKSTDPAPTCADCPEPGDVDFSVPMSYPLYVSAATFKECKDWIETGTQNYNPGPGPCHRDWKVDKDGTTLKKACYDMEVEKTIRIPCSKKMPQPDVNVDSHLE